MNRLTIEPLAIEVNKSVSYMQYYPEINQIDRVSAIQPPFSASGYTILGTARVGSACIVLVILEDCKDAVHIDSLMACGAL
jgi:hypothetical protein